MNAPGEVKMGAGCCPFCGVECYVPAIHALFGNRPLTPGDLTVCWNCACILVRTDEIGVRAALAADVQSLEAAECLAIERATRAVLSRGRARN